MASKTTVEQIKPEQLCVGLYVCLDKLDWMEHPFLFSRFKIKSEAEIQVLKSLGVADLAYLPEKSDARPLPLDAAPVSPAAATAAASDLLWKEKRERIALLGRYREQLGHCEKRYLKTSESVKEVMRDLFSRPEKALGLAQETVGGMVQQFLEDENLIVHLMGDHAVEENGNFHPVNVTVLSLILARALGMDEDAMKHIGMGALMHDVGKARIPSQILNKTEALTQAEDNFVRQHPAYGREMLEKLPGFSPEALDIVRHHHEAADGSGYPDRLKGGAISPLAMVVAIANTYDNYCNPRNPARALTPAETLASMFKNHGAHFAAKPLQVFIRCMGIYPPGTIVLLSTNTVGLVMSVESDALLQPSVLLYDPHVPKSEAAIVDLRTTPEVRILKAVRPKALPAEVVDFLSPRSRVCYYVDQAAKGAA